MYNPETLERIRAKYIGRQYHHLGCVLCNYACNGHSIEEAEEALAAHYVQYHPEWQEYQAALPSIHDIPKDSDFTGGLSSEEYVRRMREEQNEDGN